MSIARTSQPESRARAPRGRDANARKRPQPAQVDALKQQRDLALALGEADRLEQALDLVLKAALRVEGVECGGIYVVEHDTGRVTLVQHANLSRQFVRAVQELTMPAPVARQLRQGRTMCYTARPVHTHPLYEAEGLRAVIAIPIRLVSGVVAALNLASRSADAFTPAALSALKTITAQVGGTLRRIAVTASLEQSEHRLHALFDATTDVAILMQPDGKLLLANDRMRASAHAEQAADLQGASVYKFLPPLLTAQRRRRVQEAVRTKKPVCFVDRYREHWFDQRIFPVLDRRGKVVEVAVFQRDITTQRRLEQEIVRISEFEKHQLGQTLHDTLVQHLAGTAFLAEVLERRLTAAGAAEAADAHRVTALIREGALQARGVARGLSPLSAFGGGLEPALLQLAQDTRAVYGVPCLCTCNIRVPPASDQTANHIYYIAREAVSNAARHGHPTSIWVRLVLAGAHGLLRVTDNGRGLPPSEPATGLGLNIMRYRAEALGGTVTVKKRRPQGTIVLCRFPLRERPSSSLRQAL